ncbi:amidohydrolase family protein [Bradyrhizobium tropiciagri]|uniref:amidohydrolase family protein n=1 Tax=Bradyrhizobium tropiciagri TaxID=312253 RepID=UPI001BADCB5F|nr:amidohydrolase family protein [Bradyrhizobium tropiciagri]MBR0873235.1 amidohydrolase family protein [Bradyrhizobium tropiciagri]
MAGEAPTLPRGNYLIKGGSIITVDPELGTLPKADLLVKGGAIVAVGDGLSAESCEVIDASDMIVMPGMVDTHYHMWSTVGRNFLCDDGFEYYQAKWATASHYSPDDFYNSVSMGLAELAYNGVTTVNNWSHNNRSPAHVDAELGAHQASLIRARYSIGHVDQLATDVANEFEDLDRVRREWFDGPARFDGLVHLGVNLRGMLQSDPDVFHAEMDQILKTGLPISVHASQGKPNTDDAEDYERRGYLGPNFLFCHYIAATDSDRSVLARTRTPLSFATHSELRLGDYGDPRAALLKAIAAGVLVTLSSDASSLAPPNMFENMRLTWNMTIPWKESETEHFKPIGFYDVIRMATINGAIALGLGDVIGSITPGKRADIILVRANDLNIAPRGNIETAIVQSAMPANVDTVLVDGRIIKRHGKLTAFDTSRIVARAEHSALRIRQAAGGILTPRFGRLGNPICCC